MSVRLLILLFVIVLFGFAYISLMNGQHIQFNYSGRGAMDITVAELAILSFSLGAAMVILGTLVKDVTLASRNWKERRDKQRREAARARVAKAQELSQKGMLDEAVKELERSLSVNQDDREALELLSRVETERGNSLEAVKALTRLKQLDPSDISVFFRLAALYRRMNDLDNALSLLKTIEDSEGDNPRAWSELRDIYLLRKEMVPAYTMQKKIMKSKGKSATAEDQEFFNSLRYEKAVVRMAEGKTDDAERRLRELIKEHPQFCASYITLSERMQARGDIQEAMDLLIKGYRVTRNVVFLIKLEDLGVETENPQWIIGVYAELLQEFPSDFDANLFMGKFFLRLEMNDEAVEQLLKAESLEPDRESVHILLAEAFRRRGRYESASQHYQRAFAYKRRYLIPFCCTECGKATIKWAARCSDCGAWNSYAIDHGTRDYSLPATMR